MGIFNKIKGDKKTAIVAVTLLMLVLSIACFTVNNVITTSASNADKTIWNFGNSEFRQLKKIVATNQINGLTFNATSEKHMNIATGKTRISGETYKACLKLNGMGNLQYRSISFEVTDISNLSIVVKSNGKSDRYLVLANSNGNVITTFTATKKGNVINYDCSNLKGLVYLYSSNSGINIYKIELTKDNSENNSNTYKPVETYSPITENPTVTEDVSNNETLVTAKPQETATPQISLEPVQTATPQVTNKPSQNNSSEGSNNSSNNSNDSNILNNMTAEQIVSNMGTGWNLGNTLDSTASWISNGSPSDYETAWGNQVTTKEMITAIKNAGFKTIRVPVSWGEKMDSNYNVNETWMNRVQEVVDYGIDNGMYVILNVHHDGTWLYPDNSHKDTASKQLQSLWTQIATRFKNYDQHLIFETMNEPRLEGTSYEWTAGTEEAWSVINHYNKTAVDAIRAVGGNNNSRAIMIPTYAANPSAEAINALEVPNNDDMLILSVHGYSPYYFSMVVEETAEWGSTQDKTDIDNLINTIYSSASAKGLPVVIGEFGTINKNNTSARANHASYYVNAANSKGIACVWWDNGVADANVAESYSIFDRSTLSIRFNEIVNALVK